MMMMSSSRPHSEQIDSQTHTTDDEQLRVVVHHRRLNDTLHRLEHDKNRNENQEDAVGESTERLDPSVSICKRRVSRPGGHDTGEKTHTDSGAVEKHVDGIADQTETVGPHPPKQLYTHEGKVEHEELEDLPRVWVGKDHLDGSPCGGNSRSERVDKLLYRRDVGGPRRIRAAVRNI